MKKIMYVALAIYLVPNITKLYLISNGEIIVLFFAHFILFASSKNGTSSVYVRLMRRTIRGDIFRLNMMIPHKAHVRNTPKFLVS